MRSFLNSVLVESFLQNCPEKTRPPPAHSLFTLDAPDKLDGCCSRKKIIAFAIPLNLLDRRPAVFVQKRSKLSFGRFKHTMFETAAAACLNRQADPVKTFMHKKLELSRISIFGRPCGPKSFIIESPAACLSVLSRREFLTPRHAPAIVPLSRFC